MTFPESQIKAKDASSHNESIEPLALLRMADFSAVLNEWEIEASLPNSHALPQVAAALKQPEKLNSQQRQQLVHFLQQHAKQGNQTAILYLAYLFAIGLFVPQLPQRAVTYISKLMQQGDWRASRFWAEMLLAAPNLAYIFLADKVEPMAQQWQQKHNQLNAAEIAASIKRFYACPSVIKLAAKQALEQAIKQGSPTAAKRLRGLTMLGQLPVSSVAREFHNIANWLDKQVIHQNQLMT